MTVAVSSLGLLGSRVALVPMERRHFPGLLAAATTDRASFALTSVPKDAAELERYMAEALSEREHGAGLPFVICAATSGQVLGSTRFAAIQRWGCPPEHWDAVEIGWTWLLPSVQRSGINREMKWLMLEHAFEQRHARRVQLKTDARNLRSREAIAGVGATFEGILRNFGPAADGPVRDVAMFSIIDSEWAEVATRLKAKLRSPI
jgi:RimJ/RimL family protein N-acetyltransferase